MQLISIPVGTSAVQLDQVVSAPQFAWAGFILWLPLLSLVLCGICAAMRVKTKLPAIFTIVSLAGAFVLTAMLFLSYEGPVTILSLIHI